jgi:ATP adenylyltransferase
MERLWAPWRLAYVAGASGEKDACIFCKVSERGGREDLDDLIVARGRSTYVILNLYPYNSGHLMIVPDRHVADLATATPEELSELMRFTRRAEMAVTEAYAPQGINIGINLGRTAGAGIVGHLHVHLVPRWNGDTNFMSVVGNVRVLPEDLGSAAKKLRPIFGRLEQEGA